MRRSYSLLPWREGMRNPASLPQKLKHQFRSKASPKALSRTISWLQSEWEARAATFVESSAFHDDGTDGGPFGVQASAVRRRKRSRNNNESHQNGLHSADAGGRA